MPASSNEPTVPAMGENRIEGGDGGDGRRITQTQREQEQASPNNIPRRRKSKQRKIMDKLRVYRIKRELLLSKYFTVKTVQIDLELQAAELRRRYEELNNRKLQLQAELENIRNNNIIN
ncbi:hypothetical protein PYW08_006466 [Mythimna loreyi]|uniref:Uncharacterized protein n=1 Tax=Mythimna loreyi TaxID=667449 RepID=A0ACC2QN25_9NEOP|nr:hypothetical protein PYW08_006466 [Mythimna loreyi]